MKLKYLIVVLTSLLLQGFAFVPDASVERLDYDRCRQLVESKEILSVAELTAKVKPLALGYVIDIMLLKNQQQYIYEMEVAGRDGVVRVLYIDAQTGRLFDDVDAEPPPRPKSDNIWDRIIDWSR